MTPRIFIVDDHRMMREALRRTIADDPSLEFGGEAGDANSAWTAISENPPAIILMDLDIPGGGGMPLIRRIHDAFPAVRILVVTGQLDARLVKQSLDAGASGYLLKTNGAEELLAAVETVISGKTYLCADTATLMVNGTTADPFRVPQVELPEREKQVLQLLVDGLRNKEIAAELGIGIKSVETYRSRVMKRLDCASPAELVRAAIDKNLVDL